VEDSSILVVGISGASGSGKTACVKELAKTYPCVGVVHGDSFFRTRNCPTVEWGFKNMEIPEGIDWTKLLEAVLKKKEEMVLRATKGVLLVEGFLLFACPPELLELFDKFIFLTVSHDISYVRRRDRKRRKNLEIFEAYFEKYVWPCHLDYKAAHVDPVLAKHSSNSLVIDAETISKAEVLEIVQGFLCLPFN